MTNVKSVTETTWRREDAEGTSYRVDKQTEFANGAFVREQHEGFEPWAVVEDVEEVTLDLSEMGLTEMTDLVKDLLAFNQCVQDEGPCADCGGENY